ncbi:MAG: VOC family protein [Gemmatimonadota bacterium]
MIDHLVYAAPDLEGAVEGLERLSGIRAAPGGRHPGWGTRNALLALGPRTYLEILAPDPDRSDPELPAVFGLAGLQVPRLVAWAARAVRLEERVADAARQGVRLGDVLEGSRESPDGTTLAWRLTDPSVRLGDGVVPFLIDWGSSAHPAGTAPKGAVLENLRAEHPDPSGVRSILSILGLPLRVDRGHSPALVATLRTSGGPIELR